MAATADDDARVAESDPRFAAPAGLELALVRYEDAPDRCTLSPRDVDEEEVLTHWLSVDASLAVPLSAMR
ncbi:DUF7511 domain-containing protein [Halorarum halobium]|uniref:DUF7511 domain-containing protein n=1 Tax=Halorarum halobium TaxID=3075121 RepID=UPI0028A7A13C|nr:hypothetical protein [Halobaculum sp. XH14]